MTSLAQPKIKTYLRKPESQGPIHPAAVQQSFYPDQIAALYNFPKVTGAPQTIAICELGGGYVLADVKSQLAKRGIPMPTITDVSVRGAQNSPGDPQGADGEVMLDIICAAAAYSYCTGKPADILMVFAPNDGTGMSDATHAARTHPKNPCSISWSWGAPEDAWSSASIAAFEAEGAAAKAAGITILAAAGDNGSSDGETGNHVDYPAASQYVVGCGGTILNVSNGAILNEQVWNDGSAGGSTGGGLSALFPTPDWQKPVFSSGKKGRGVPDWAGNASPNSGYIITVDGQEGVIGGTSAVAPLFAGLVAALVCGTGKRFSDPATLYTINSTNVNAFRDIVQGNNGGFSAGPGYDCDTGLGVPVGNLVLSALQGTVPPPPVPVVIPNVVGLSYAVAKQTLTADGLTIIPLSVTDPTVLVTTQSPAAGVSVATGTSVTVTLAGVVNPPPPPPPGGGPTEAAVLAAVDATFKTLEANALHLGWPWDTIAVRVLKQANAAVDAAIKKAWTGK